MVRLRGLGASRFGSLVTVVYLNVHKNTDQAISKKVALDNIQTLKRIEYSENPILSDENQDVD